MWIDQDVFSKYLSRLGGGFQLNRENVRSFVQSSSDDGFELTEYGVGLFRSGYVVGKFLLHTFQGSDVVEAPQSSSKQLQKLVQKLERWLLAGQYDNLVKVKIGKERLRDWVVISNFIKRHSSYYLALFPSKEQSISSLLLGDEELLTFLRKLLQIGMTAFATPKKVHLRRIALSSKKRTPPTPIQSWEKVRKSHKGSKDIMHLLTQTFCHEFQVKKSTAHQILNHPTKFVEMILSNSANVESWFTSILDDIDTVVKLMIGSKDESQVSLAINIMSKGLQAPNVTVTEKACKILTILFESDLDWPGEWFTGFQGGCDLLLYAVNRHQFNSETVTFLCYGLIYKFSRDFLSHFFSDVLKKRLTDPDLYVKFIMGFLSYLSVNNITNIPFDSIVKSIFPLMKLSEDMYSFLAIQLMVNLWNRHPNAYSKEILMIIEGKCKTYKLPHKIELHTLLLNKLQELASQRNRLAALLNKVLIRSLRSNWSCHEIRQIIFDRYGQLISIISDFPISKIIKTYIDQASQEGKDSGDFRFIYNVVTHSSYIRRKDYGTQLLVFLQDTVLHDLTYCLDAIPSFLHLIEIMPKKKGQKTHPQLLKVIENCFEAVISEDFALLNKINPEIAIKILTEIIHVDKGYRKSVERMLSEYPKDFPELVALNDLIHGFASQNDPYEFDSDDEQFISSPQHRSPKAREHHFNLPPLNPRKKKPSTQESKRRPRRTYTPLSEPVLRTNSHADTSDQLLKKRQDEIARLKRMREEKEKRQKEKAIQEKKRWERVQRKLKQKYSGVKRNPLYTRPSRRPSRSSSTHSSDLRSPKFKSYQKNSSIRRHSNVSTDDFEQSRSPIHPSKNIVAPKRVSPKVRIRRKNPASPNRSTRFYSEFLPEQRKDVLICQSIVNQWIQYVESGQARADIDRKAAEKLEKLRKAKLWKKKQRKFRERANSMTLISNNSPLKQRLIEKTQQRMEEAQRIEEIKRKEMESIRERNREMKKKLKQYKEEKKKREEQEAIEKKRIEEEKAALLKEEKRKQKEIRAKKQKRIEEYKKEQERLREEKEHQKKLEEEKELEIQREQLKKHKEKKKKLKKILKKRHNAAQRIQVLWRKYAEKKRNEELQKRKMKYRKKQRSSHASKPLENGNTQDTKDGKTGKETEIIQPDQ